MNYNIFIYHLFSNEEIDSFLTKDSSLEFIILNFQKLIKETITVDFKNIDFVFNYYDNFYYKFFVVKIMKNETLKVDYLLKIDMSKINKNNKDNYLYDFILKFQNDDNKLKVIDLIENSKLKSKIYLSLNDKNIIKENINKLTHDDALSFLLSLSDEEKMEYIRKGYYVAILICSLSIENFYKEFGLISDANKLQCIDKIEIPQVKYEILVKYKELLTEDVFLNYMSKIYMDTLDPNLRAKIMTSINNKAFNKIIYSGSLLDKKRDLESPLIYGIKLAKNYSIGVELETYHEYYQMFLNLERILKDWPLKEETTVTNGVEINSNIMYYNKKSLSELLYVCNFLNENDFKVNDECSNHIHIGFSAFKSVKEIKTLLELFANNENIFYMMANEKESPLRKYYASYARPISVSLENTIYLNKLSDTKDLFDFMFELQSFQEDRLMALNLSNAYSTRKNTIEFRMSNGQTKYEEVLLNIILYLKLVDISINYRKIDKSLYEFITNIETSEEERKNLLLHLLFKENPLLIEKFDERYTSNNEINSKLQRTIHYNRQVKFK